MSYSCLISNQAVEVLGKTGAKAHAGRVCVEVLGKSSPSPVAGLVVAEVLGKSTPYALVGGHHVEVLGRWNPPVLVGENVVQVLGKSPSVTAVEGCWLEVLGRTAVVFPSLPAPHVRLNAEDIAGLAHGDPVSSWAGGGRTAVQPTPMLRPTYITDGINGRPCVRFAWPQRLVMSGAFTKPVTIFIVARSTGPVRQRILCGDMNNWLLGWWNGYKSCAFFGGWVKTATSPVDSDVYCYGCVQQGSISAVYQNGTLLASNSGGTEPPNGLSVGGGLGEYSDCDVAEVIIYQSALTTEQRVRVEEYLMRKYGILT
jgi:hypothetical protein